jgi:hypothetical protein
MGRSRHTSRWRARIATCVGACLVAGLLLAAGAAAHLRGVAVTVGDPLRSIPPDFFGLSVESNELAQYESAGPLFDRMISLMRAQDGGPTLLRIGGTSADEVYWGDPQPAPRFVTELDPTWMSQLGSLARRDRLRVELVLNLAVHSPSMAVAFAQAARAALPNDGLAGLAIGNEPDLYKRQARYQQERIATTIPSTPTDWTDGYSSTEYRSDYLTYAAAIEKALTGTPLEAPDLTFPNVEWPSELVGTGGLAPRTIAIHRYAAATCSIGQRLRAPTDVSFLGDRYSAGLAESLDNDVAFAHAHRAALRVTEMNSISCSRKAGIASSFATALWSLDALFEMLRVGVDGINWHIRPNEPNSPFHLTGSGLQPLPELYGLTLFGKMLGPASLLMSTASGSPDLKAWAVRSGTGLRLLLINRSARTLDATADIPNAAGVMRLARLEAPGLGARRGVTLAGRSIGPDGQWVGTEKIELIRPTHNRYEVSVPAFSAALGLIG